MNGFMIFYHESYTYDRIVGCWRLASRSRSHSCELFRSVASTVVDKQNNCIKLILIQFKMEKDEISTCIPLLISYIRFNGNEMNSVWRCFHTIRTQYGRNMANRGHAEENKAINEHNSTNRNSAKIEFEMCLYASWAILCKCSHKYIFFSCFVHMVIHNHVMINVRCRETSNTSPNCQQQQ